MSAILKKAETYVASLLNEEALKGYMNAVKDAFGPIADSQLAERVYQALAQHALGRSDAA